MSLQKVTFTSSIKNFVIFLLTLKVCGAHDGAKYEFGMFENFVVNEKVFSAEIKALELVKRADEILHSRLSALSETRAQFNDNAEQLQGLEAQVNDLTKIFPGFTSSTSKTTDLKGSLTGLVVLAATYDLSVSDLVSGNVVWKANGGGVGRDVSGAGLKDEDLLNMAMVAFDRR